jgi:hypothetical protein
MSSFLFTTNPGGIAPRQFAISFASNGLPDAPTGSFPSSGYARNALLALYGPGVNSNPGAMFAIFSPLMGPGSSGCFVAWPIMQGGRLHLACFSDI